FDFEQPARVRELIGPYSVKTTYYDRDGRRVELAASAGPYRAVVRVTPETGRPFRRFVTLFRTQAPLDADWHSGPDPTVDLNRLVDDDTVSPYGPLVRDQLKGQSYKEFSRIPAVASLLAGVSEYRPGDRLFHNAQDAVAVDRQRWVALNPSLSDGFPTRLPFDGPRPIEGQPATVLHVGTPAEAGFRPGSVEKVDAVCRAWAADSDQAFAVCVARHGVVVLHKAYGTRDGRAMTVDTPSWMASATKTMSACLMMMLVDQGLVDLDAPVDAYLPALRGLKCDPPLTVRHLYTHTSGLDKWPNWADNMPDVEDRVADTYERLKPGREWVYNSTGYVLGGKVIENLTGEAVPNFYRNHLLDPLGCPRTEVYGTHADAYSVPLDMARFGQMLLNRGAYGSWRFFSEETFDKMLPRKLTKPLGPDTRKTFGLGLDGLPGRFGHGTASSAVFQVDRVNDLVVIVTRNTGGTNWEKYQGR
ncbi:MAG: beta-lactamase family protein, partial [Planctomycetia bacterium]|nr:beta-lactamase family protein [Planctomycetia bacterium]